MPETLEPLKQGREWILLKSGREEILTNKYSRMEESLSKEPQQLKPLTVGDVMQVQNQTGKDALRWNRSGVVVESLGNQQ